MLWAAWLWNKSRSITLIHKEKILSTYQISFVSNYQHLLTIFYYILLKLGVFTNLLFQMSFLSCLNISENVYRYILRTACFACIISFHTSRITYRKIHEYQFLMDNNSRSVILLYNTNRFVILEIIWYTGAVTDIHF